MNISPTQLLKVHLNEHIDPASRKESSLNATIEYRNEDYLSLNEKNRYDLIMMIFTDFGVLFPQQRKNCLPISINH